MQNCPECCVVRKEADELELGKIFILLRSFSHTYIWMRYIHRSGVWQGMTAALAV